MKENTDKLGFVKIKSFCSAKHYQENEKTNHRIKEDICKRHRWSKTVIPDIQKKKKTLKIE